MKYSTSVTEKHQPTTHTQLYSCTQFCSSARPTQQQPLGVHALNGFVANGVPMQCNEHYQTCPD